MRSGSRPVFVSGHHGAYEASGRARTAERVLHGDCGCDRYGGSDCGPAAEGATGELGWTEVCGAEARSDGGPASGVSEAAVACGGNDSGARVADGRAEVADGRAEDDAVEAAG